jgi:hypothetical protein
MTLDFVVTRRALTLGAIDDVTGWYAKSFSETEIEMIIQPKGSFFTVSGMGFYARHTLTGFTQDAVVEGDEIKDSANVYYEIKTSQDYPLGDSFIYRECELAKVPIHYDMPTTYGTAPTVQDPRQRSKVWLDLYLTAGNLTKDDNSTPAQYITSWAKPPYPIIKVFETKGIDLVFSIATPTSEGLPLNVGYIEHVPITVFTIDKTGITGNKLRWKGEAELRRLAETHAVGSLRSPWERMSDNEENLGSTTLYSVTYVLRYKRYA